MGDGCRFQPFIFQGVQLYQAPKKKHHPSHLASPAFFVRRNSQGSNRVLGLRHFDVQMMGGEFFFGGVHWNWGGGWVFGRAEGGVKRLESLELVEGWLLFFFFFGCKYSVCLGGLGGGLCGWNETMWHFFYCWEKKIRRPISLAIFGPGLIIKNPRFCWSHFLAMSGNHHGYIYISLYLYIYTMKNMLIVEIIQIPWLDMRKLYHDWIFLGVRHPWCDFCLEFRLQTQWYPFRKFCSKDFFGGLKFFVSNPATYNYTIWC